MANPNYGATSSQAIAADYAKQVPQPIKPVNPSCFGNVEDVRAMAVSVAQRVESMVERLVGVAPPEPAGGETARAYDGLFGEADENARSIRVSLQRVVAAVDRLEKHLP